MRVLHVAWLAMAGLAILSAGFLAWVWFASEAHFRNFPAPPPFAQPIPDDEASLARGQHLTQNPRLRRLPWR